MSSKFSRSSCRSERSSAADWDSPGARPAVHTYIACMHHMHASAMRVSALTRNGTPCVLHNMHASHNSLRLIAAHHK